MNPQTQRLANELTDNQKANASVEAFRPFADMFIRAKKELERPVLDSRYCQCKTDCNCIEAEPDYYCLDCGITSEALYEDDGENSYHGFYCARCIEDWR